MERGGGRGGRGGARRGERGEKKAEDREWEEGGGAGGGGRSGIREEEGAWMEEGIRERKNEEGEGEEERGRKEIGGGTLILTDVHSQLLYPESSVHLSIC